eukprot:TRINITY_DN6458_c0_g1_i2.p1 TRINITY_DN6458_c0_g1~~TRINITY_DN6458_c0_g1_i2.p1  ORF type:complete len:370 (-),score=34.93 TRINITY_DN6458_c0_g1_i2:92-1201(-)
MALSKHAPEVLSADAQFCAWRGVATRVAEPLLELFEDTTQALMSTVFFSQLVTRSRDVALELTDMFAPDLMSDRVVSPLSTERSSTKTCEHEALVLLHMVGAAAGPVAILLLGGPSLSPLLVVSSFGLPTKTMFATVSVVSSALAFSCWLRFPEEKERRVQNRSALCLFLCSAFQLGMLALDAKPVILQSCFASLGIHPASTSIALHCIQDFICNPLLIVNLGYIAGRSSSEMLPCIACTSMCTLFAGLSALSSNTMPQAAFLSGGVFFLSASARTIQSLHEEIDHVKAANLLRSDLVGDLMVFGWSLYLVVQGLGVAQIIGVPMQFHAFGLLDVFTKAGCSHIMLRSRKILRDAHQAVELSERGGRLQ